MRLSRLIATLLLALGVVAIWPASASGVTAAGHSAVSAATPTPPTTLGAPIIADLNGDGSQDKATLGQIGTTTTCTVTVQNGLPGGGFGPAKVHRYTSAEHNAPFCPNLGAAIKLGSEKRPDLVTGFSFGFEDVVALHEFRPSGVFRGVEQPDVMVAVDFRGNGHADLMESTNQGQELATLTNTPAGTLVRALSLCQQDGLGPQYALADFDGNGGQTVALSHVCPTEQPSVEVLVFGAGGFRTLTGSCNDAVHYTVFVINGIDIGLITTKPGAPTTIRYFHNDGAGHFTQVTGPGSGPVVPIQPPSMGNPCGSD